MKQRTKLTQPGPANSHPISCLLCSVWDWSDLFIISFSLCVVDLYAYHRCPECDGAGFVRKAGATLRANAARKDQAQIVCARCNGLGKLNQIDK
jgi:hypothetical protein